MSIRKINKFDLGLALGTPEELIPDGGMRSCRGIRQLSLGSFRSRPGSALLYSLNAHSLFYFSDQWYSGVSTSLYRAAASIKSSLSGNRLSFSKMAPVAGIVDYLFFVDGSNSFKSDSDGNVTNWGFDAPASNPSAALAAGGSLTADALYQYKITYKNSTTGHRSNGNTTAASATPTGANLTINLSSIPDGSLVDSQISHIEIWRTVADGAAFFLLDTITTGTATYSDDGSESLSSVELPTDNLKPYTYFDECLGPFNASMFWITRTEAGQRGRLFYSPVGRAESLDGFIEVASDSNPLQKIFRYAGQLGVIAEAGIFLVGGTNPYIAREIPGCPGTTAPNTVVTTPYGIAYEASDGIYLFNGSTSILIGAGAIERLFRGESVADLTAFTGVVAAYARGEYIISDGSQTLAFDTVRKRIRDVGVGLNAVYYNPETDQIGVSTNNTILDFEKEGEVDDNGTAISIIVEPRHFDLGEDIENLLQFATFDVNTNNQSISVSILHDGDSTDIGELLTSFRDKVTIPVGITGHKFGVRFIGSISEDEIEIYSVTLQIYQPGEEDAA